MTVAVRPLALADATACDAIVASLPYHFGQESGRAECAEAVRTQRGLVAETPDDGVVGFLTLTPHGPPSVELTWLAVRRDRRGRGIGRLLVERACADLAGEGVRLLHLLTVSEVGDEEPDQPDGGYAATRAFYAALGFVRLRDLPGFWGDDAVGGRPTLLVRPL